LIDTLKGVSKRENKLINKGGGMKKGLFLILILIMIVPLIAISLIIEIKPLITRAEAEIPTVIINEVAWAGSSVSSADEWIELKNTTSENIELTGWQVTGLTNDDSVISLGTNACLDANQNKITCIIQANGYFLIANNDKEHTFTNGTSVLNTDPNYITSAINIASGNMALKISLYNGDWQDDGLLIDEAWDGSAPSCGSNSAKTSMERNKEYGLGNLPESWHEANEAINLDEGIFDKATPKAPNSFKPLDAPMPIITSVVPNTAEIDTIFEIEEITGDNFVIEGNTQIQIYKDDTVISATEVHVASPTIIDSAQFDLTGTKAGNWDLIIINPDTQETTLPNAFLLTEPEEEIIYSNDIIINELYPKPDTSSNDEFIELYNTGSNSINLQDWKLDDQYPGGSAEYTITDNLIIEPYHYLTFSKPQTHISLNDTGDYVRLIQPDDNVLDETPNYGSAEKGYSYSLIDDQWQWSLRITKNQVNVLELPEEEEEEDEVEVELFLDFDELESASVLLTWAINVPNKINNITIYQSGQEEKFGQLIATVSAKDEEYLIENLEPGAKYFFTITSSLPIQSSLIESNQIEITTLGETINNVGLPGQIKITEILPNPAAGQDEFIELYNPTEEMVNIAGWRLVDASSRSYTINSLDLPPITITTLQNNSVILSSHQYILLEQNVTNLHLNNSGGEELYLLDTEDNIIDSILYAENAKRGYVYVLAPNEKWFWSDEMTPGEANDISFAGITGNATDYLTASGSRDKLLLAGLISLGLSVIMFTLIKRYDYSNYK